MKQHPECARGFHLWVIRQVGRSTQVEVCWRCGETRPVPKGKK